MNEQKAQPAQIQGEIELPNRGKVQVNPNAVEHTKATVPQLRIIEELKKAA